MMELMEHKCCICGKKFVGWGNNPWPVNIDEKARCCDKCNDTFVIPARLGYDISELGYDNSEEQEEEDER